MDKYNNYMRMCIKLAKKGLGKTSPNPLVGCVVLDKNDKIIAKGFHKEYGKNHAERDALLKLKNGEEIDGTLIVNLEPCNHQGKTPPCTDLIISRKIKRVVVGSKDTNPLASGGIKKLKEAGIEVIVGVLKKECDKLNEIFFTNITKKRTYIALKTATTIDGKIATKTGDSKWITSENARNFAKKLRKNYDAILTSSSTVLADNPRMEHNLKIILDRKLKCNLDAHIFKNGKIIIFNEKINMVPLENPNIEYVKTPVNSNKLDIDFILDELYKRRIMSIFVEAGGNLLGSFIKTGNVDKLYHFIAPKILNDNLSKSAFDGSCVNKITDSKQFVLENIKKMHPDLLVIYKNLVP